MSRKYSVIIPVFNCERSIALAVSSMLRQVIKPSEIIVVDDNSTDRTVEIVKAFRDERIKLFANRANSGVAYSLNKAISVASCDVLLRMDGDDFSLPTRSIEQLKLLECNPLSVVGTDSYSVDAISGKSWMTFYPMSDRLSRRWLSRGRCPICHPSAAYAKDTILSVGGYNIDSYPAEDLDCWSSLSRNGTQLINTGRVGIIYRIHSDSVSRRLSLEQLHESKKVVMRLEQIEASETEHTPSTSSVILSRSPLYSNSWLDVLGHGILRKVIDRYQDRSIGSDELPFEKYFALALFKILSVLSQTAMKVIYLIRFKKFFIGK